MSALYLDTSAVGRILLGEPDAPAILDELAHFDQHVSSRLLRLELRRLALGHDLLPAAAELLATVALVPVDAAVLDAAEVVLPADVAALDSIHLATALRLAADGALDAVMTYDRRLAAGLRHHGVSVVAPAAT